MRKISQTNTTMSAARWSLLAVAMLLTAACGPAQGNTITGPMSSLTAMADKGSEKDSEDRGLGKGSTVVYTQTFQGSVGTEWSKPTISTSPSGARFLGDFSNETVQLSLAGLPAHASVTLTFDAYAIGTWDGLDPEFGPDSILANVVGGQKLVGQTMNFYERDRNQIARGTLGYAPYGYPADAIYRFTVTFKHASPALILAFSGKGLQSPDDERWGIDNVTVAVNKSSGGSGNDRD
jgi:hypothetical protein